MAGHDGNVRVERMPFTIYDIIGYLAPGTISLWFMAHFLGVNASSISEFLGSGAGVFSNPTAQSLLNAFVFVISAYIVGHFIGLLSSLTVEKLALIYFDYPSKFVANFRHQYPSGSRKFTCRNEYWREVKTFVGLSVQIMCFPLVPWIYFFEIFGWWQYIIKPLPGYTIKMMIRRFHFLSGYSTHRNDWFRFVSFYVINNNQIAFLRMYNYMTIYGLMRNICFTLIALTWILWVSLVWHWPVTLHNISSKMHAATLLASLSFVATVAFVGFLKFYRRYTEEAVLAFVATPISSDDEAGAQKRVRTSEDRRIWYKTSD